MNDFIVLSHSMTEEESVFFDLEKGSLREVLPRGFLITAEDDTRGKELGEDMVRGEGHKIKIKDHKQLILDVLNHLIADLELVSDLEIRYHRDIHVEFFKLGSH